MSIFRIKKSGEQPISAPPYQICLAKTYSLNGKRVCGRTVLDHCHIVGSVARALLSRFPNWLQAKLYPAGSELIAAAHDIGKISPTFQTKICDAANIQLDGLKKVSDPKLENAWGGHGGVSQATTEAVKVGKYIPEIVGQHHGYSPNLGLRKSTDEIFGGPNWERERIACLEKLKSALNTEWPIIQNDAQARVIAGLTTVSDWIGSGQLFEDPNQPWNNNIELALNNAGFVLPKFTHDLSFFDIFGFEPRDVQKKLFEVANKPGVYILEAPMGHGKTEAALYAAYIAMSAGNATGIYFALPTQLTSNKICERVDDFLNRVMSEDNVNKNALLLHGSAWVNAEFGVDGEPGGSWFHVGKRGILAPFAVGTIDQALMAVMNVKHGFVRAFGLAGKVVILDEVHSYDAYTGTILDTLVKQLQSLQCTVIILSATLTHERRSTLLLHEPHSNEYPLVTSLPLVGLVEEFHVPSTISTSVQINVTDNQEAAINEALSRAMDGQQVLWIENTVSEAQNIYKILGARADNTSVETGLLHSRFIKSDREQLETKWVNYFGKGNADARKMHGRILVGTQVLEQSIDIDADFLITRICPTDMLLQRIGRLWRHRDSIRSPGAVCEAWILSPMLSSAIKNAFGSTSSVYSTYVLCRTLEVWSSVNQLQLPESIRPLIEATYKGRDEINSELQLHKNELEKVREKLTQLAYTGLSQGNRTISDINAKTRYNEENTVDVLLVKDISKIKSERANVTRVTFLNGDSIDLNANNDSKQKKRATSATLYQNIVKVREKIAPEAHEAALYTDLGEYLYIGSKDHDEPLLRFGKVLNTGEVMHPTGNKVSIKHKLWYNQQLGYQADK